MDKTIEKLMTFIRIKTGSQINYKTKMLGNKIENKSMIKEAKYKGSGSRKRKGWFPNGQSWLFIISRTCSMVIQWIEVMIVGGDLIKLMQTVYFLIVMNLLTRTKEMIRKRKRLQLCGTMHCIIKFYPN